MTELRKHPILIFLYLNKFFLKYKQMAFSRIFLFHLFVYLFLFEFVFMIKMSSSSVILEVYF